MPSERLSNLAAIGATLIAAVALVASQFKPLHEYFAAPEMQIILPGEIAFTAEDDGVAANLRLGLANVGEANALVIAVEAALTHAASGQDILFGDPMVSNPMAGPFVIDQPKRIAFSGFQMAPGGYGTDVFRFLRSLSPDETMRLATVRARLNRDYQSYNATLDYYDHDAAPDYEPDEDLVEDLLAALRPQLRGLSAGAYVLTVRCLFADNTMRRSEVSATARFELTEDEIAYLGRNYDLDMIVDPTMDWSFIPPVVKVLDPN